MWPHENALFLKPFLKQECKFVLYKKKHKSKGSSKTCLGNLEV